MNTWKIALALFLITFGIVCYVIVFITLDHASSIFLVVLGAWLLYQGFDILLFSDQKDRATAD